MKFVNQFKTLESARTAGSEGLYSPQFCIVKNKPARNYKFVEGVETFVTDFDDNGWFREPESPTHSGDVVFVEDGVLKTASVEEWGGRGTIIGVIAIPKNFLPDGKLRMVALTNIDKTGAPSSSAKMKWGPNEDSPLTDYLKIPIWNNDIDSPVYNPSPGIGFMPSDSLSGMVCACDHESKYFSDSIDYIVPSPYYLDGSLNTAYTMTLEGGNIVSDFNGKENTSTLVSMGSEYEAANACAQYRTEGTNRGDWYLPAAGELGIIISRLKSINDALEEVGGDRIGGDFEPAYWSSTDSMYEDEAIPESIAGEMESCILGIIEHGNNLYVRPVLSM